MDIKEWFPEFQVSAETDVDLQSIFSSFLKSSKLQKADHGLSWVERGWERLLSMSTSRPLSQQS
jgi:hypothetical protein